MENQIDKYISQFPDDVKLRLTEIRRLVKENAPGAVETINYGMPTFKLNGNLIHYAGYKNHIGIYPLPDAIEYFTEKLKPYKTAKGSIQFPNNKELPLELIEEIIIHRVNEKNTSN